MPRANCQFTVPDANICILLLVLDRKHSKVSKTVKILSEYNRTDIAGETLRKIKTGSGFYFENCIFHSLPLLDLKGYEPDFPIASSRCQQSSDIVSGFYFEK